MFYLVKMSFLVHFQSNEVYGLNSNLYTNAGAQDCIILLNCAVFFCPTQLNERKNHLCIISFKMP